MERIYGGVIKGIIKIISSHLYLANLDFVNINPKGVAIRLANITTNIPNNKEFFIVRRLSLVKISWAAWLKFKRPSMMIALKNTVAIGVTTVSYTHLTLPTSDLV